MDIKLISDSCCDVTPTVKNTLKLGIAPLKITVDGTKEYVDDGGIPIKQLLADMKASKLPVNTAAPSPEDFARLMRQGDAAVVVTLSRHLSGSYNAAIAARDIVQEETPEKQILVLDSKSASAGQLRIMLHISCLISRGADMQALEKQMPLFINGMRTLFVLEDLGNLIKNGRIPKMAGVIGTMLMLRPIMGENGNGEIVPLEKVRGTAKAMERLVEIIAEKTAAAKNLVLTLSYCNQPERAAALKKNILAKCPAINEVIVTPTGGLSTCYANDGGVILAFA